MAKVKGKINHALVVEDREQKKISKVVKKAHIEKMSFLTDNKMKK